MSLRNYRLSYATINRYDPPVRGGHFLFLLIPCEEEDQAVRNLSLKNSLDEEMTLLKNAFGFTTILLSSRKTFSSLELDMMCELRKNEQNPFDCINPLTAGEEREQLQSLAFRVDHLPFLQNRTYTSLDKAEWSEALPTLGARERVFDYLVGLNTAVHRAMRFEVGATDPQTTAREAWRHRKGVCQDYAHIMLAVCRAQGIAARYVSGYLSQGDGFAGDSQMHAWIDAYVPGLGWKGFDPSNDLLADHHHIKVAHGVDYDDCPPINGVVQGAPRQKTNYRVQVVPQQ